MTVQSQHKCQNDNFLYLHSQNYSQLSQVLHMLEFHHVSNIDHSFLSCDDFYIAISSPPPAGTSGKQNPSDIHTGRKAYPKYQLR